MFRSDWARKGSGVPAPVDRVQPVDAAAALSRGEVVRCWLCALRQGAGKHLAGSLWWTGLPGIDSRVDLERAVEGEAPTAWLDVRNCAGSVVGYLHHFSEPGWIPVRVVPVE